MKISRNAGEKLFLGIFCALISTGALLGGYERISNASSVTSQKGIVIALYTYPTDGTWAAVIQAKQSYPSVPVIAIINPNSGPGGSKDPNYVTGIINLENAGVTVIGYVATGYGTSFYSSVANIEHQVNQYRSWYPKLQGIFFDEMSTSGAKQTYYQTLKNYVSSLGMQITFGNPGTTVDTALLGIFTNLVIYENPGLPTAANINQYYSSNGNSGFSFIAYGVSTLPSASSMQNLENFVSYIYVTNLGGSNPYGSLPTYFANEVASLDTSSATSTTSSLATSTTTSSLSSTSISRTSSTSTSSSILTSTDTSVSQTTITSTVKMTSSRTTGSTTTSTMSSQETVNSPPSEVSLRVNTMLSNGETLTGYYVALSTSTYTAAGWSFSPASFTVQAGQNYVVTPENYGSYVFSYWNDTHSTLASRTVNISQSTTLVAVYTLSFFHIRFNSRVILL